MINLLSILSRCAACICAIAPLPIPTPSLTRCRSPRPSLQMGRLFRSIICRKLHPIRSQGSHLLIATCECRCMRRFVAGHLLDTGRESRSSVRTRMFPLRLSYPLVGPMMLAKLLLSAVLDAHDVYVGSRKAVPLLVCPFPSTSSNLTSTGRRSSGCGCSWMDWICRPLASTTPKRVSLKANPAIVGSPNTANVYMWPPSSAESEDNCSSG